MIELGELAAHQDDFARRNARIVVVSLESPEEAAKTKQGFPHFTAVADSEAGLITAAGMLHPHAGPGGADTASPGTVLIDKNGMVRWFSRPDSIITRLSPDELLAAVDRYLP